MPIYVKEAKKSFNNHDVFKDVNMTFNEGTITGIIGRNGSGKTVLFKCILGLYRLTSGKIIYDEEVIGKDIDLLKNVGTIIENPGFINNENGLTNLKLLYTINNPKNDEHLKNVLNSVGLDWKNKTKVINYSLGMKQRLAIAQSIMEDPKILILDEPMNGLDSNGVKEVRDLLINLKDKGKIIILASHSTEDISILCDRVYRIEDAEIKEYKKIE